MSGHSKWHNIQAKKGKADAARGKIFTKLGRELLIATKEGGPDPAGNSKLKAVIAKCKAANMPNDTINNAIKKASTSNENYEEIVYEGYGPNGVAVIVEASTDNKNRTAADVRHVFDKAGGNLGTTGCVSYMFNKKGVIVIDKESTSIISSIVAIADALSASRPGARNDSLENYVQRLKDLEAIADDIDGVEKSFAVQAGRELRVLVKSEEIDDLKTHKVARDIKNKIEENLQYPGTIKVTVIRETRVIEEAK